MAKSLLTLFFSLIALAGSQAAADTPPKAAIADGVATEIAYLLGAADQIVGVDQTSRYPAAAIEKPQLGYFRRLSAEGVLALTPDVLIASPYAGPPPVLEQLRSAGLTVAVAPDVRRLAELPRKATFVGEALGRTAEAAALAVELETEIAEIESSRPKTSTPTRVLFVLTIQDGAPLVAGDDTGPGEVIRAAGAENVAGFEGFKPMSKEAIVAAAPDLLLMTEEHSARLGGPAAVLTKPEFVLTPAGRERRALAVPALTVLGIGPRTPETVRKLRAAF